MIFNVEETVLIGTVGAQKRRTAITQLTLLKNSSEEEAFTETCGRAIRKLKKITDTQYRRIDFSIYEETISEES